MTESQRLWATVSSLMAVAALVFLLGISWGLPSGRVRAYLYGSETPWSGERISFLAGGWDTNAELGADVDRNPLMARSEPVMLNGSDQQRAEILRRYLLYSYQPDEMITFRALAQMRSTSGSAGGSMDPKLYQYGGLWIYPVGALIRIGMSIGAILAPAAGDSPLAFYLENPDAFGRFYVAARLYTLLWGIAGVWAVYWLARRLTRDNLIAGAAAASYIFMPVVMNGAHEAKPHLPGAVLMLLAIVAAVRFVETGKWLWGLSAGALCGAALGMVLSSLAVFLILPVMVWKQKGGQLGRRIAVLAVAVGLGVAVYAATNPYVLINLLNRDTPGGKALRSNLRNSTDMYHVSFGGFKDAIVLLGLGASPLAVVLGVAGAVVLIVLAKREKTPDEPEKPAPPPPPSRGPIRNAPMVRPTKSKVVYPPVSPATISWLLLVPAGAIVIQFFLLAAGKPPEYARFGMFPDIILLLLAARGAAELSKNNAMLNQLLAALVVVSTLPYGMAYCRAFVRDAREMTTRTASAEELPVTGRILLHQEPAPCNCPPFNVFQRDIVLVPKEYPGSPMTEEVLLYPVDAPIAANTTGGPRRLPFKEVPGSLDQFTTPITWANKTFAVEAVGGGR